MHDYFVVGSAIGMILLIVIAILRLKVSPVIALVAGSIILALINGISPADAVDTVLTGFGDLMAKVGLLLFFGLLLGTLLTYLGGVTKVANGLLKAFGAKAMPYTFGTTVGTVMASIFPEVNMLITAPLAKKIAPQLGKTGLARMTGSIMIGVETALTMVIPGVAVLALAGVLNVPVGLMLLVGVPVAVLTIVSAIAILSLLFRLGLWKPEKDEVDMISGTSAEDELEREIVATAKGDGAAAVALDDRPAPAGPTGTIATRTGKDGRPRREAAPVPEGGFTGAIAERQPNALISFAPLLFALVIIAVSAIVDLTGPKLPVLEILGSPTVALLIAFIGTQIIATIYGTSAGVGRALRDGTAQSGEILILTGVGACLAAVVQKVGIGDILIHWFEPGSFAPVLVVWVIAAVLHLAIGSVTTSAITAAGILAPIVAHIGVNPAIVALAAGAGSMFMIHVTSNAFWMMSSIMGFSTRGAFKTITLPVTLASITGLFWVFIASLIVH